MERQLKYFFDFLENEKKLSENTLQSYRRDLKQFKRYLESYGLRFDRVKKEDIEDLDTSKLVKTPLGNGQIEKISVNLSSRMNEVTLKYDTE